MSERGRYRGQRVFRIAARTMHLVGMAALFGGALYGRPPAGALILLVLSGGWIVADDVYKYGGDWFRFVQGWAVMLKMGLLLFALAVPAAAAPALVLAIVVGGVVSHAPGRVRQAALWGPPGPCAIREPT